eukprot:CAMPEP_0201572852 /NCGR_PEP_ID=MMETSP0190_2-20130828/16369_1 /ASSEMBLY_ACC=CAM_ASM_000263 /TAXON_ID=37353 /ORGANISM="Rosalina sp." /LENGTH=525 /DNA_ID=CAMNT_0047999135 /DNA_START=340 /DNA_END=1917 /DNA_ORIENTATION=-
MSQSKKKQLMRELNVMKKVDHPNVIKLITFNAEAKYPEANGKYTPCIMTALEFAAGGELFDYLMYTGHFDDAATRSYFKQLIDGLDAMHSAGIAHRDLKPENLLMDSSFTLKIADFGFATEFMDANGNMNMMKTPCGTKNYLAPEFWKGQKYSYKCDIFAAGIILFTTYAGFPPFMEAQPNDWWWDKYSIALEKLARANELRKIIKQNKNLDNDSAENKEMEACLHDARKRMQLFWKAHSKKRKFEDDDFKDIALNLIHPKPENRMDIKQIIKHKWFTKGPFYNKDELKLYLTKRVKIVLQGRARKIRKLMQEQQSGRPKNTNTTKRALGDEKFGKVFCREITDDKELQIWDKLKDGLDKEYDYDYSLDTVKDGSLPNSTWQFMTKYSPGEVAVRLQNAAVKNGASVTVNPKDNIITIKVGFMQDIEMPDGEKIKKKETITFCAKQFFLYDAPKLEEKDTLLFRRDIFYLVSFKRLQGTFDVYNKMVSKFLKHEDLTEIVDFETMGVSMDSKDDNNDNDDQKDDK